MAVSTNAPLVQLSNVTVVRDGNAILRDVSLTIRRGEHVAILGPNGAGKSTLIKVMTREIHPHAGAGEVRIGGEDRAETRRVRVQLATVSQDQERFVLGRPTVRELVLSGLLGTLGTTFGETVRPRHKERAQLAMKLLEVEHLADRAIDTLSSGENRRAWIARAMATEPSALILDEPMSNLDVRVAEELRWVLRRLAQKGTSIVLVTHRHEEIIPEITRVLLMRSGQIIADGPREELLSDARLEALFDSYQERAVWKNPETPAEYVEAMRRLPVYDVAIRSPLERAPKLSEMLNNQVWLKREDLQPVRSFKLRGAYSLMSNLPRELLARGVIAASAGNHAQGVAISARRLETHAIIVVPRTTPAVKIDAINALGAELILYGDTFDEAYEHAIWLGKERHLTFIHPFDQPAVIAGQGTVGLEIAEAMTAEKLDTVFAPVGGGGLLAGVAMAIKHLKPGTKVVGVEPDESPAMSRSLAVNERVTLGHVGAFADGVAVKTVGQHTFAIARKYCDEVILVSNDEICGAIKEIFEDRRAILEPAGALAFAGLKKYVRREKATGKTLVAIASGANLDFDRLRYVAERAAVGEGREAILAVTIPEQPGSFRAFCSALGERSITEFNYRFGDPKVAHVFVGVAIKGQAEHGELFQAMQTGGYPTVDLTGDELATTHLRHMVGGRSAAGETERLFAVDFPERPGTLMAFLDRLGDAFNITLFHYRNHGSEIGRVLVGIDVPAGREKEFARLRVELGYPGVEVTKNEGLRLFVR